MDPQTQDEMDELSLGATIIFMQFVGHFMEAKRKRWTLKEFCTTPPFIVRFAIEVWKARGRRAGAVGNNREEIMRERGERESGGGSVVGVLVEGGGGLKSWLAVC
ncbi:hypothetical protein BJ508DRAFT_314130 [Ascobolus immersus RN42]|uniref:Uncharacterized protein n=1 Tax=Ascobolus immersus RN42 TaxID=1160509 RepID=A0A3N4HKL4_ASCIM|nr:hypothetical protein BJ508DRAFT_314130 [Ascobolus immersus RN42]